MKLSEVLESRGYVYQKSTETLPEITDGDPRVVYLGIDPTADSLHVGNLQNLLILRHFLEQGHKVIILVGGGTGMIGDPSGKSEERNLLDQETVNQNANAIASQITRVFGSSEFTMVNNAEWLSGLNLLEFLRDVGKHFTINSMVKKEMVRERLESESPISYTEFAYSILQGYDFLHLHETMQCDLQIGASDQWGNIMSGIELIRKKTGDTVYGFTAPLLINKATGKKFGKSEAGAVWLDTAKTSPFAFYQFWLNTDDEAVEEYLKKMTMLPLDQIEAVLAMHRENPAARIGQKALADAVTALVHGTESVEAVKAVSDVLFGDRETATLSEAELGLLTKEAPVCEVKIDEPLADVLVRSGLVPSKREARQMIADGAVTLNGGRVTDANRELLHDDFENAPVALLKRGKRNICVLRLS